MIKKIGFYALAIFIVMQFFRIDKVNPKVNIDEDFLTVYKIDEQTKNIIKNSCYDCHSNETVYPWYSNIAPISWMIKHHIDEGKEHVNFSTFSKYNNEQKEHIIEECVEVLEHKEMPLAGYVVFHKNAQLDSQQNENLISYFKSLK